MNFSKSNIPLMRLGDIRRTLKKRFNVIPGHKIKLEVRTRDDENCYKIEQYSISRGKIKHRWLDSARDICRWNHF